jgi:hypothetical protein
VDKGFRVTFVRLIPDFRFHTTVRVLGHKYYGSTPTSLLLGGSITKVFMAYSSTPSTTVRSYDATLQVVQVCHRAIDCIVQYHSVIQQYCSGRGFVLVRESNRHDALNCIHVSESVRHKANGTDWHSKNDDAMSNAARMRRRPHAAPINSCGICSQHLYNQRNRHHQYSYPPPH